MQLLASSMPVSGPASSALAGLPRTLWRAQCRAVDGWSCSTLPCYTALVAYLAWVPAALSGGDTLAIAACPGGSQRWRPPRFVMVGKPCWWETTKGAGTWISPRPSPTMDYRSPATEGQPSKSRGRLVPKHRRAADFAESMSMQPVYRFARHFSNRSRAPMVEPSSRSQRRTW